MSEIVIIGAGQTGRGYLARFFNPVQDHITFIDKDIELISRLNEIKSYKISFGSVPRDEIIVYGFDAYKCNTQESFDAIKNAHQVWISVGQKNIIDLTGFLENSLSKNHENNVDVFTAENGINVSETLRDLRNLTNVHLSEAIVFCTTISQKGSLDIFSEDLDNLPYDCTTLTHKLKYKGMVAEKHFSILMQRKIYTYNCISACIAYTGYIKNYHVYSEAANDKEIDTLIHRFARVLNPCISKEYGTPLMEQVEFSNMAIRKFQNKDIVDSVTRNARNARRKLGNKERIIYPLLLLAKHNAYSDDLLNVAAYALHYGINEEDIHMDEASEILSALPMEWQNSIINRLNDCINRRNNDGKCSFMPN